MASIEMDKRHYSHTGRYVALALLVVIVASLLLPTFDGLNVAGFLGDKTYLLVLQDNSEMRGSGGLMSVVGVLTIHDGQIASLKYHYSHTSAELQTIVPLDGPKSLTSFFDVNAATLFDSNVQYDLASFAPKVQSDWYDVTGQKVDGVIVLDFTAVEAIMNVMGPVVVSGEVITSRNVADRLEFDSATGNGQALMDLLSTLTFDVLRFARDSSLAQKVTLYNTLQDLASEKHVFIYPNDRFLLRDTGGERRAPTADLISVVDFNLGNGKSDFGIARSIDYHVQLLPDGTAVANLTLTYRNGDWWASDLFTQVLVPPGAKLTAAYNVSREFNGPETTNGNDYTVFSSRFIVSPNSTARITYLYTMPNRVDSRGIGHQYDLYVTKQAGLTRYVLSTEVQLPPGASLIHEENVGPNLVFTEDAHVSVVWT
jgi:hypothetical protein